MKDLTQNPDLRQRDLPDDYFGDWKWREGIAELMVPIIGNLYRNGINIMMYGQSLVNLSPTAIMKAHRFVRQTEGNELSEMESYPILKNLIKLNLADCEIDLAELTLQCSFFNTLRSASDDAITHYLSESLEVVLNKASNRPNKPTSIVLYGFGRIGRLLARVIAESTGPGNYFRLKAIVVRKGQGNDLLKRASLLRNDSVHGAFSGTIRVVPEQDLLVINGNPVKIIYANNPQEFNYSEYGIDAPVVIDNTGVWRDRAGLGQHIASGAYKVILTAPGKDDIKNIVYGINHSTLDQNDSIISAASCTTNAIVPVLKIINDAYGIDHGHIESIHSYTNDQNLIDNYHKGDRRGRSAALNLVITTTGAAKAVVKALPELANKLTGNAIRVPTPNVSLAVLTLSLKNAPDRETLNEFLRNQAFHSRYREILGFVNNPELVSTDFYSSPFASIIDAQATIAERNQITLYCWYDNEYGYTKQVLHLAKRVMQINLPRLPNSIS
ncbi:MAG: glyceraldehyde-3-phosphate dehydrogenase [Gammaproteobacteria bacterium]